MRRRCLSEGLEHRRLVETMIRRCGQFLDDDAPLLTVIGIQTRGAVLGFHGRNRLAMAMREPRREAVHFGIYQPPGREGRHLGGELVALPGQPLEVAGRHVVVIDDVIRTGRTMGAALAAIAIRGRPLSLRVGCLIDGGGRELPIHPDAVGLEVALGPNDRLHVAVEKIDSGLAGIWLDVPIGAGDAAADHPTRMRGASGDRGRTSDYS
jgi:pyrimidine operon attenuation protein/uracil phosphoribosyltransferase